MATTEKIDTEKLRVSAFISAKDTFLDSEHMMDAFRQLFVDSNEGRTLLKIEGPVFNEIKGKTEYTLEDLIDVDSGRGKNFHDSIKYRICNYLALYVNKDTIGNLVSNVVSNKRVKMEGHFLRDLDRIKRKQILPVDGQSSDEYNKLIRQEVEQEAEIIVLEAKKQAMYSVVGRFFSQKDFSSFVKVDGRRESSVYKESRVMYGLSADEFKHRCEQIITSEILSVIRNKVFSQLEKDVLNGEEWIDDDFTTNSLVFLDDDDFSVAYNSTVFAQYMIEYFKEYIKGIGIEGKDEFSPSELERLFKKCFKENKDRLFKRVDKESRKEGSPLREARRASTDKKAEEASTGNNAEEASNERFKSFSMYVRDEDVVKNYEKNLLLLVLGVFGKRKTGFVSYEHIEAYLDSISDELNKRRENVIKMNRFLDSQKYSDDGPEKKIRVYGIKENKFAEFFMTFVLSKEGLEHLQPQKNKVKNMSFVKKDGKVDVGELKKVSKTKAFKTLTKEIEVPLRTYMSMVCSNSSAKTRGTISFISTEGEVNIVDKKDLEDLVIDHVFSNVVETRKEEGEQYKKQDLWIYEPGIDQYSLWPVALIVDLNGSTKSFMDLKDFVNQFD